MPAAEIPYNRSRFSTRLLEDRLYTAGHSWLEREDEEVWRVGFTKFAVRMLGEIVELGFETEPGATVETGQVIGWLEGFKAVTDMYSPLAGRFEGFNPAVDEQASLLSNDPYRGNTHIPDLVTAQPVFVDGKQVFWTVARGHQLDTGAIEASSIVPAAKTIFQEGIVIPPTKLVDRGVERHDIVELYLANVRYRDALHGDLRAQLGACGVARKGLIELCEQYGRDEVVRYSDGLMDYADQRASEEFCSIPDGIYHGETWTDTDGNGAIDIPIRATITKKGADIHVHYSGGPPSTGSFNATYAVMMATSTIPFLYYIDSDIPHNHGVLQHISADADDNTICLAKWPAAVAGATQNPADPMHEVINIAMAEAIPERVPAGSVQPPTTNSAVRVNLRLRHAACRRPAR